MLKGEAKTAYQREYMRRRRAEQGKSKPGAVKSKPQTPKAQAAHSASRDAEIEALRDQVITLKTVLQGWSQFIRDVQAAGQGLMSPETFKLVLSCLHPDSRNSLSDKKLGDAFRAFSRLRLPLTGKEAEMKKVSHHFTAQEWEWMRFRKSAEPPARANLGV